MGRQNLLRELRRVHVTRGTVPSATDVVENGFSVVGVTGLGLSAAYDYQGRTLATMDYFRTDDRVFTAFIPETGTWTVYSQVGDVLG